MSQQDQSGSTGSPDRGDAGRGQDRTPGHESDERADLADTTRRLDAAARLRSDVLAEADAMRGTPGEDRVRTVLAERSRAMDRHPSPESPEPRVRRVPVTGIVAGLLAVAAAILGFVWLGGLGGDPSAGGGNAPGGMPNPGGVELRLGADGITLDPATDVQYDAERISRVRWESEIPATAGRTFRLVFFDAAGIEIERIEDLTRPEFDLAATEATDRDRVAGAAAVEVTVRTPSGERIGGSGVVRLP